MRSFLLEVFPEEVRESERPQAFMGDQFELSGVPPGRNQLIVTVDGGQRAAAILDMGPGETAFLELTASPGVSLTGRLVDAATRAPSRAAYVSIPGAGPTPTSEEGRFTLHDLPAGQVLFYAGPGPYPGTLSPVQSVRLLPGQDNDLGESAHHAP
ncbi:MAG: hypothetical protein JXB05_21460 [Myxococcaceae bacterium]|nr:hypothetical protein [Myxococcaceae bacterium]